MRVSAPNVETILAYELQLEPAWVAILAAADLKAYAAFSDGVKATPFVDVILTDVKPTGHKWIGETTGLEYFDAWDATLACSVTTQRGKNSDKQAVILGALRNMAQRFYLLFDETNLPYHAVGQMKEAGLTRGINEQERLDFSELRFAIRFNAVAEAWPATA